MSGEPWYSRWFGREYLEVYPHRDGDEAERAVALLLDRFRPEPGTPVLDLACGAGRHLRAMRARGLAATGLDLSLPLLFEARDAVPEAPLVRGDMRRLPFRPGSFRIVTSFFTSFGYFDDEDEDRRVLAEVRRLLAGDGALLIDFLNADEVRRTLTPRDEAEVQGRRVVQERTLLQGGRLVEKRIRIEPAGDGPPQTFRERVRLYELPELEELLGSLGLAVEERLGDYEGAPFTPGSPRLILLARRTGRPRPGPDAVGRVPSAD